MRYKDGYQYYRPMPLAFGSRLSDFQAIQYELDRICLHLSRDIFKSAFTDAERQVIDAALNAASQRAEAGIAEFDDYKLPKPVLVNDDKEYEFGAQT